MEDEIIEYGKRTSHFGYYDILRWMHEEYGKAPNITLVYKALQKLEEQGKVKRLSFDSGVKYEVPA